MIDAVGQYIDESKQYRRIISLVPSQTEYLIDLLRDSPDQEVVGRTKFCIHPSEVVSSITIVGGTKQIHFDRIEALSPDLIIINKEENTEAIADSLRHICSVYTTEVKTVVQAYQTLENLGTVLSQPYKATQIVNAIKEEQLKCYKSKSVSTVVYLIWKDPYMTVGGDTFINDMMREAGYDNVFTDEDRYPSVTIDQINAKSPDYIFLSSEPFPFKEKHKLAFDGCGAKLSIVDGEMFSWYGSRMLKSWQYFQKLQATLK